VSVVSLPLPDDFGGEWMTLSDAAERLGWHLHKVQSRARREEWRQRKANRGRAPEYLVPASLLTESAALAMQPRAASAEPSNVSVAASAELLTELGELRSRLDSTLAALAKSDAESVQLRTELAESRAELAALRERTAKAEGETAHWREMATRADSAATHWRSKAEEHRLDAVEQRVRAEERAERITDLQAELSRLRRPWWRRLGRG
jgi:chromosome segregation ATPase